MHWKKSCKEHAELYRQLCEECPHFICFLTAVCKSGKIEISGKKYSPRTKHVEKPETRNALSPSACICAKQYNQKLSAFHYRNDLCLMAHVSNQRFEENVEKICSASNFTSVNLNCALHADDIFVGPEVQIYKSCVKYLSESCIRFLECVILL